MARLITQFRRGTTAEWEATTVIPDDGELIVEETSSGRKLKLGDGRTEFKDLEYIDEDLERLLRLANSRIDNLVAPTTVDSELIDMRVDSEGVTHESAGAALRFTQEVLNDLSKSLDKFKNAEAVDGLLYEGDKLYLTANNVIVSDPVTITGGSGGGGGGTVSSTVIVKPIGPTVMNVSNTDKVSLQFEFSSKIDDEPTGDGSVQVSVQGVTKYTGVIHQDEVSIIPVTSFLKSGTNNIRVTCTDIYGNYRTIAYTVTVVEIRMTSSFNSSRVYKNSDVEVRFTPYGELEKTITVSLNDGKWLRTITGVTANGREMSVAIPQSVFVEGSNKGHHGSNRLKIYAQGELVPGQTIPSNILEYDLLWDGGLDTAMIGSVFSTTSVEFGTLISIPFTVYDPKSTTSYTVKLLTAYDEEGTNLAAQTREDVVDGSQQWWSTQDYPENTDVYFIIRYYRGESLAASVSHKVHIGKSSIDASPYDQFVELALTAKGRSNTETESRRSSWKYGSVSTTFNNFNWSSNGWLTENSETFLRLTGNSNIVINYKPFDLNIGSFFDDGRTLEFEFAIRDVNDRSATPINIMSGNIGFSASADKAVYKSNQKTLSVNYKENEKVRISISVQKAGSGTNFISVYMNGVLSAIDQYAADDTFHQSSPVNISIGSDKCSIDLYSIRIYKTYLDQQQILENYIADQMSPSEKLSLFNDNDLYVSGKLSYKRVKEKLPTIVFIGKMPTYKGDKKKDSVRMIFKHPTQPDLNFDEILKQIDVQGTSSAGYARKNWKTKHNTEHVHMKGELPTNVFCLKVDYAEATGTHNTQNANLVETFYSEPIPVCDENNIPPTTLPEDKKAILKTRTTITGFPSVIFHLDTNDSDLIRNITIEDLENREDVLFSSKSNFNYDKDSENVFAFTSDFDTECWEFLNNSDTTSFLTPFPSNHTEYWEARYHKDLGELEELDEKGDDAGKQALADSMIARFKIVYDWVHSTYRGAATGAALPTVYVDYKGTQHTHDTADYRLAKFRTEFDDYFNRHYTAVYYVYTFFALMVDQRAKNLFLTYWLDDPYRPYNSTTNPGKWYPYFYDNDTSYGINNTGHLVFDYFHEDTDTVNNGSAMVYNGQNSVLWCNFRDAFPELIEETYRELRSSGKLTYDTIIDSFITNGSEMWSASVYNEDAWYKYVSIATVDSNYDADGDGDYDQTAAYLYQVRGNGEDHLKYFVENRLKYCDSKWNCESYPTDRVTVRVYSLKIPDDGIEPPQVTATKAVVPPNPKITVTPYSNMYCGVQYGAVSGDDRWQGLLHQRAEAGDLVEFEPSDGGEVNDKETYIYGASQLSSIGDLAPLYPKLVDVQFATKLIELKVGDGRTGYYNGNLETLTVGSNTLLKTIDIQNCPNFKSNLNVANCINIQTIKAWGSGITGVDLPDGGYVTLLQLPGTTTSLNLKNQVSIQRSGIQLEGYSNVTDLHIENCPLLTSDDVNNLLSSCTNVSNIYLTGLTWSFATGTAARQSLSNQFLNHDGSHKYLNKTSAQLPPVIGGTCHITELTGADLNWLNTKFPEINITWTKLSSTLTYMADDDVTILLQQIVSSDDGYIGTELKAPYDGVSRPSTAQYRYEHDGWSTSSSDDATPLSDMYTYKDIKGDRTLYPTFRKITQTYSVTFMSDNETLLTVDDVPYGDTVYWDNVKANANSSFLDADRNPIKQGTTSPEVYTFKGFIPDSSSIVGNTVCYAQFEVDMDSIVDVDLELLDTSTTSTTISVNGFKNKNDATNPAVVKIAETYEGKSVTSVSGFSNETSLELLLLPDHEYVEGSSTNTPLTIGISAFEHCSDLQEVTIPVGTTAIGQRAFSDCPQIKSVNYNAANCVITWTGGSSSLYAPFDDTLTNNERILTIGKDVETIPQQMFAQSGELNSDQHGFTEIDWDDDCKCTTLENYAFVSSNLKKFTIGRHVSSIGTSCFGNNSSCSDLSELESSTVTHIGQNAFNNWKLLEEVNLPVTLQSVRQSPFARCFNLGKIHISGTNTTFVTPDDNCLISKDDGVLIQGTYNCTVIPSSVINSVGAVRNVVTINNEAFVGMTKLTSVEIPSTVSHIGSYAFANCSNLQSVSVETGSSLKNIEASCFSGCSQLSSISLPTTIEQFGSYCFSGTALTEDYLLDSYKFPNLKIIQAAAFDTCTSLVDVSIPNTVTTLGQGVFQYCSNMETLFIPASVTTINTYSPVSGTYEDTLLRGCSSLVRVTCDFDSTTAILDSQSNTSKTAEEWAPWGWNVTDGTLEVIFNDKTVTFEGPSHTGGSN